MRFLVCVAVGAAAVCFCDRLSASPRAAIIPETTVQRHGLTRPWFTQIQLDRSRARLRHVVLHEEALYLVTDRATVHAINAETGATLWVRQVGRPNHPSMVPGLNKDLLAIINGSRLYVCNRYNGDLLFETQVDGAPGAGPALSDMRAYVPMVNGLVLSYRLDPQTDPLLELGAVDQNQTAEELAEAEQRRRENIRLHQAYIPPLACQSLGRTLIQPLVTRQNAGEEFVAWPTDRGHLNIGYIDRRSETSFSVKYRLETNEGIASRPTYRPSQVPGESGLIYAASRDGFVHAVNESNGQSMWRFSTGEPILQPAVVIGDRVYVATQPGGMYCLDATTGKDLWFAPSIAQFVSAGKHRLYVTDKLDRLLVLNLATGARLDMIPLPPMPIKVINEQTDRLYLATSTGLIHCLREQELVEPIRHRQVKEPAEDKPAENMPHGNKPNGNKQGAEVPPNGQQPAGQPDPLSDDTDPFADDANDPAADPLDGGGNPFGDDAGGGDAGNPFDDNPFD